MTSAPTERRRFSPTALAFSPYFSLQHFSYVFPTLPYFSRFSPTFPTKESKIEK